MTDKHARAEQLASQIMLHKKLYYSGKASIPDVAYDTLEDELKSLEPEHPVLSLVGYTMASNAKKVAHEPPMLSLSKTYDLAELNQFTTKNVCVLTDKFDGMAIAVEYNEKGQLTRASTRGSGKLGEDVTEHIFHVADIPKVIKLPSGMFTKFEVRGEIYFPISKFKPFEEQFDSYRNAVPGTFGRKEVDGATAVLHVLKLCTYDVVCEDAEGLVNPKRFEAKTKTDGTFFSKLKWLENLGFHTGIAEGTTQVIDNTITAEQISDTFSRKRDYQIDGLVFRMNDEKAWDALGVTAHHPRGSLAFKQTSEVAITKILAIEENVGRSGKITFRAKLEPVFLSGAKITYATLHNAEFIQSGNYAPGAMVKLTRSGEVIPSIIGLETAADDRYVLPTTCPCGYELTRSGPDLFCYEKRACVRKDQESLVHFVATLDILGVSEKTVMRLREAGLVQEPADLFKLTPDDLVELDGFAQKSAENAIRAIQEKREIPLAIFLASLGLKRGGIVKCQDVARRYRKLDAVLAASAEDLKEEKGWADKSAEDFVNSLHDKKTAIESLLRYVKIIDDTSSAALSANAGHPFFGKTLCITGALSQPRDEYKKRLESVGAKVSDSVSSKTNFLVCNEASGSSKYTKAQTLGIPILTEAELVKELDERQD